MIDRRRMLNGGHVINGVIQDSLEKFIEICQSGKAPKYYDWGDKIIVPYGEDQKLGFAIVGFNVDDKSDGTGKAKVTLLSVDCPSNSYTFFGSFEYDSSYPDTYYCYHNSLGLSKLYRVMNNSILPCLPSVLKNAIVAVNKTHKWGKYDDDWGYHSHQGNEDVTTRELIFPPTYRDMQDGGAYGFISDAQRVKCVNGQSDPVSYFLMDYPWLEYSTEVNGSYSGKKNVKWNVLENGAVYMQEGFSDTSDYKYAPIAFCIG